VANYRATRLIVAPIEVVFAYRLDLENLPAYNPEVRELRALRREPGGAGSVYTFRFRVAPLFWSHATLTVIAVDPPTRLEFQIASFINAREICTFAPTESDPARVTRVSFGCIIDTPGGVLAPLLDAVLVVPTMCRQLDRELELMAARLETQSHS